MSNENTKILCLWSGPRNVSTALMYSFAERDDTAVVDEPLYHISGGVDRKSPPCKLKDVASRKESIIAITMEKLAGLLVLGWWGETCGSRGVCWTCLVWMSEMARI